MPTLKKRPTARYRPGGGYVRWLRAKARRAIRAARAGSYMPGAKGQEP